MGAGEDILVCNLIHELVLSILPIKRDLIYYAFPSTMVVSIVAFMNQENKRVRDFLEHTSQSIQFYENVNSNLHQGTKVYRQDGIRVFSSIDSGFQKFQKHHFIFQQLKHFLGIIKNLKDVTVPRSLPSPSPPYLRA